MGKKKVMCSDVYWYTDHVAIQIKSSHRSSGLAMFVALPGLILNLSANTNQCHHKSNSLVDISCYKSTKQSS